MLAACRVCNAPDGMSLAYTVGGYDVHRCDACGTGRVDIENFDPTEHYDDGYFSGKYKHSYIDYLGSQETISREFAKTLKHVRAEGPQSGKLLEIGCAYGLFLQHAKEFYDVYGVEIVPEAAAYCQATGLPKVKSGVLTREDMDRIGEIDVAVMLDVIEHIDDIEETFGLIAEKIRIGGRFFVTTGDWSSLAARITGKNWRLMAPPLHLWYFTPRGLVALGRRFGLEVVSVSHPWKIVPLDLIIQQGGVTVGLDLKLDLPAPLKSIGLPANMWDAMRVVFRKTS